VFLSKLTLNPRDRQTRCDLAQPYEMHRTLWRAFPPREPGRVLFRVDADRFRGKPVVLVQSDGQPEWQSLPESGAHYLTTSPEVKEFDPSLATKERLRFRLRANPTKKVGGASKKERLAGKKDHGQRIALLHEQEQMAWLLDKGEGGGFRILGDWTLNGGGRKVPNFRVEVVPEGWVRCGKNGHTEGRFFAVRFDGLLEVTDPGKFLETLRAGIGSAKGFGFGLLSLAPAAVTS